MGEKFVVPERGTPKQGNLFWCNSLSELELAVKSCTGTDTHVSGVLGIGGSIRTVQTDSFDVWWFRVLVFRFVRIFVPLKIVLLSKIVCFNCVVAGSFL